MEWKSEAAKDRIIVALDCSGDEAVVLGEKLAGHARWVKIGMTLYYAVGPSIVNTMHKLGFKVFLDLKLHDIPHQVYGAASSIAQAGADLFTVHASGGELMLESAERGARKALPMPAMRTTPRRSVRLRCSRAWTPISSPPSASTCRLPSRSSVSPRLRPRRGLTASCALPWRQIR